MEGAFPCRFKSCGRQYSTKYSLQRHCFVSHYKSKRFTCKVCKKTLSSNQNLKEHLYTHSNEKPLTCSYPDCGKIFRQSSQLSNHKHVHEYALKHRAKLSTKYVRVTFTQLTDLLSHSLEAYELTEIDKSIEIDLTREPLVFISKN